MIRQNGACYRCLKTGHLSRVCSSRQKCTILDDLSKRPCNKSHHPILHEANIAGISFHQTRNQKVKDMRYTRTLLMLSEVLMIHVMLFWLRVLIYPL